MDLLGDWVTAVREREVEREGWVSGEARRGRVISRQIH